MSIKISIKNSLNQKLVKNHVFFTNKNFKINELSKLPISKYSSFINQSLSSSELADKNFLSNHTAPLSVLPIFAPVANVINGVVKPKV